MSKKSLFLLSSIGVIFITILVYGVVLFQNRNDSDEITSNNLVFKVIDVQNLGNVLSANPPFDPNKVCTSKSGEILYIVVSIENQSDTVFTYNNDTILQVEEDIRFKPVQAQGALDYTACIDGDDIPLAANIGSFSINSDSTVEFALIYDVPQDTDEFTLIFLDHKIKINKNDITHN